MPSLLCHVRFEQLQLHCLPVNALLTVEILSISISRLAPIINLVRYNRLVLVSPGEQRYQHLLIFHDLLEDLGLRLRVSARGAHHK